ncbi:hypothetical protein L211DRAFT_23030 [Terfezia boudieri ATCC MYA-4762]|uniref:Transcription factor BYE1 n=1 Tax=Terfezia boudieri ATCC MYA-4762 TaxID=1051890 RepID=A0A3N4MBS1_9PEZI|nr:hypothetical protein L211DRAFT_23030 [Terfezia boudieri ATCC MYA-4762]
MMVQCEGCKVWQHCECLELDEDELEEDKDYYCEVCKPENHEEFLAKVERGEKPWEMARKNRRKRKGRRSTGKGKKGKATQAKKKGGKKVEPEPEPEPEPEVEAPPQEVEPEAKPEAEAQAEAQADARAEAGGKPDTDMEEEPKPQVTEVGELTSQAVEEEGTIRKEADPEGQGMEEDTKEGVGVGKQNVIEKINGGAGEIDETNHDVEKPEQETHHIQQVAVEEKREEEDVKMSGVEEVEGAKPEESEPQEETPMPPPQVLQSQFEAPQDVAVKEDEEMADAPEKTTPTPVTPTAPMATRQRESKRKVSMPEPQRVLRRKTTHDSDGDYQSESDMPHNNRRASTSTTTKQEPAKESSVKPSRRPSVPKPTPKKPSGPDDISVQAEAVEKVDDLRNNARRNIVNFLGPIIEKIVQQNENILSENQKKEQYFEKLALEIEYHLYLALWNQHSQPTQQYKLKARGIGLNLPKNPVLQSRLLKGEVTPESLVQMKPEEMASEEFQLMAEQVRRESEIQNTILAEETGPRIRRTHKGEEIVEDDMNRPMVNDEPFYSGGGGGDAVDHVMEEAPSPRSRAVSQAAEEFPHSPPQLKTEESIHSAHIESAPQTPRTPLSARTPITARGRQFSIEGVWNNVNTPEGPTHPKTPGTRQAPHMLSLRTTTQPKSVVDAEIDKLLAEEDHEMENETPPYSPSELTFTDSALPVWRGRVSMISVSNFRARAYLLGGPEDAQHKIPLNDLLGGTMLIDGRIGIDRATEYLCGQKFSQTNEIIVLTIEPEDHIEPTAATEFNKLFQYFQKKERYGVVGRPLHKYIKDCYLVPIDVRDDMPDFFECLAIHSLEQTPRKKRVFAVVFVLSKTGIAEAVKEKLEASRPKTTPETHRSPLTRTPVQQQPEGPQYHNHQQQHYPTAQSPSAYPSQAHPNYQHPYPQPYGQQQHPYVTPPSINHHPHGNGYHHHPYYQPQPQQQQLPIHHQHQSPPPPSPQPLPPLQSQQQNPLAQQPVKKFHFTPWKELQDALPQLTFEQVNIINSIVARNPAAQQDPGLLARLIKEHGGM